MRCPVCSSTARIQRTHVITKYLRDLVHCCNNKECAHIFVTQQEFIRTVMPSLLTEPEIDVEVEINSEFDTNSGYTVT